MSESVVITLLDINGSELTESHNNRISDKHHQYFHTKMIQNLDDVKLLKLDIIDPQYIFDENMLFHYCNVILDCYDSKALSLGLFRDVNNYGPTQKNVDIYFHPFKSKEEWHLAIGFSKYSKILLVNCSNFTTSIGDQYPSFSLRTPIEIKSFIRFFKQKLSKNALKYPRLFTDLFEPATSNNALNLLSVIFSFCLDAVSLQRSFCDPDFSPCKFEISDIHPIIGNMDMQYREQLNVQNGQIDEKPADEIVEDKQKDNLIEATEEMKEDGILEVMEDDYETTEDYKQNLEKNLKEEQQIENEKNVESKKESEIDKYRTFTKGRSDVDIDSVEDSIEIHHMHNHMKSEEQTEHKQSSENQSLGVSEKKKLSIVTSDRENDHPTKKPKIRESSVEEINDLESSDEVEEEVKAPTFVPKVVPKINLEKIAKIESIFLSSYAEEFMHNIYNKTELHEELNLNKMFDFIENVCRNSFTNPEAFADKDKEDRFIKNGFKMRQCLRATYMKGSKLEFDEDQFTQMLENDYKNQIIPIVFINDSIFLVNIKTTDNFNCIVRIFCISNRTNRSEREVLRSYALRRLIEMYVFKYNRLVTKIKLCMVPVKSMELYKVLMQAIFVTHKVMWRNKFDINMKITTEDLDNYTLFFENIMKSIERKDIFQIELNWKRLVKHVIAKSEKTEEVSFLKSN